MKNVENEIMTKHVNDIIRVHTLSLEKNSSTFPGTLEIKILKLQSSTLLEQCKSII